MLWSYHLPLKCIITLQKWISSSLKWTCNTTSICCLLCFSQRKTTCSPPHPAMGPRISEEGGVSVPLVWLAPSSTGSWRVKRRRRRPWGGNSSTSLWALVINITRRGASLSNWACSCWKSSLWLCRWIQHPAVMWLPFNPHHYHIMDVHLHKLYVWLYHNQIWDNVANVNWKTKKNAVFLTFTLPYTKFPCMNCIYRVFWTSWF